MMNLSISNIFLLKKYLLIYVFLLYDIYIYIFLLYIEYTFDKKNSLFDRKIFNYWSENASNSLFFSKCTNIIKYNRSLLVSKSYYYY